METRDFSTTIADPDTPVSDQWEIDCYSRPVTVKGKKLWELLITDATGNFKHVESIPANKVNSREVRSRIAAVIADAPVRPKMIRFFRRAMFNMLNIALADLATGIAVKPSRSTYALYTWLEQRETNVYPHMGGYKATLVTTAKGVFDIATPEKMPDALRAEQFAFVSLPLSEVLSGGDVDATNVGVGSLCPVPGGLNPDAMLPGVLFITARADNLAALLASSEIAFIKADLKRRELVLEAGLSTRYLTAKLSDEQRIEGQAFEAGKARLKGLHFIGVQSSAEADDVKGFWLCREMGL